MRGIFRRVLPVFIVLSIMISSVTICASASTTVISDDFESYDESEDWVVLSDENNNGYLTNNWSMVLGTGAILSTNPRAKIIGHNSGKALGVTGTATLLSKYIGRQTYMQYTGDYGNLSAPYKIKFDFDKESVTTGFAIRFAIDDTKANFYSLWISGDSEGPSIWTFVKVVNSEMAGSVSSKETFTKANDAENGAIVRGSVEITVDGGNISWTISGERYKNNSFSSSGFFCDVSDSFNIAPNNSKIGFTVSGQRSANKDRITYFDNFMVENVEKYSDFEPVCVLYKDISQGGTVNNFDGEYAVRRIYEPSFAEQNVTVELVSSDGTVTSVDALFDADGWWVNLLNTDRYSGIIMPDGISGDDLVILTECEDSLDYSVYVNSSVKPFYPKIMGEINPDGIVWTSSDVKIAAVTDGVITGIKRGNAIITASKDGVSYTVNLTVKGEIDDAISNGREEEYCADKRPVITELNSAIDENDIDRVYEVLFGNTNKSLSYIRDIDLSYVNEFSLDEKYDFAKRIMTYGSFVLNSIDDVINLQKIIDTECAVGYLNLSTDAADMDEKIDKYADLLGIKNTNMYYLKYKESVLTELLNQKFESASAFKNILENKYVITAYKDCIGYSVVRDVVENCADEIGYNKIHYNKVNSTKLHTKLLDRKNVISDISEIKNFIDLYVKPDDGGSGGGGGGGGFTGGGSAVKQPDPIISDSEPVKEASEPVIKDLKPIFTDVDENDWYYEYVKHLKGIKAVDGNEDGKFYPQNNVTRAEFIKMLVNILKLGYVNDEDTGNKFNDVLSGDWYYDAVRIAAENEIVLGDKNGCFNPNSDITRQEMCTILYRAAIKTGKKFNTTQAEKEFSDDSLISDWAYTAVITLKNSGFMSGYEDGTFKPLLNSTRAEAATVLSKFLTVNVDDTDGETEAENEK